ncbi:corrinoid protein [Syntrophotalea acetylenica]|uniref:Cobalamin-binding protein n=1 Tax=Syntrophotalea acetylenica TaxID=29542 RepID=A0A1L3GCT5_SYNAC|nr:corrinoid protein [Syntrophotalea acetylenica]APG23753.1 cobalamin-binding protein [Syntrophotalea acetylenica]APG44334.1 cobalamin-binding protein [Syntrophotalea acetylenica]MDY0263227.1 corrinoid protein [Syntrophotalea acetylenica]
MARSREEILKDLAEGVLNMDEDLAVAVAREAIDIGLDAFDAITNGLVVGMNRAGELYDQEEYFVPELLICSDALYAGLEVLKPHIKKDNARSRIGCVIGVVEGDTHDIGKNLVKIMLDVAGFEIYDLGRNVPLADFVRKAQEVGARLICLSTLMTTTMDSMAAIIRMLEQEGIRDQFKVLIGGGPISQAFADRIGADGYADNAASAVRVANQLFADVKAA